MTKKRHTIKRHGMPKPSLLQINLKNRDKTSIIIKEEAWTYGKIE